MRALAPLLGALVAVAPAAFGQTPAGDAASRCGDGGRVLEHAFDSGALWSVCARLDDVHGLELRDVAYRAPGDSLRPVLRSVHLGQLLVHWHDEPRPEPRLGGTTPGASGLGGEAALALDASSCAGTAVALGGVDGGADGVRRLCTRERSGGLLAKYAQRDALHGERWELFAAARQGLLTWRVGVELTEDGQIAPSVALSGRVERTTSDPRFGAALDGAVAGGVPAPTRATLLAAWRMRFALDTPTPDRVEELDFPLEPGGGGRRPMQVRALDGEVFRRVAPERFRGWRVFDPGTGAGYHLDPIDSGRAWNARGGDWARFELALTRARDCERHAEANAVAPGAPPCGGGLDAFVDAESLDGADPVLWFSRTALWTPRPEDLPFLSSVVLDTRLVPFDWTDASPFEAAR